MTFDQSAYQDETAQIIRDLQDVADGVGWLAPVAYEQRKGGGSGRGHKVCEACGDTGNLPDGQPCNECVVAIVDDAGEIVLRRHHIAAQLDHMARELDRVWDITQGLSARLAKLASLIDAAASTDERWGPPTVDHKEAAAAWMAKGRRVARKEEQGALRGVEKEARDRLDQFRKQQEAVRAAAAKAKKGGKVRNKWVGAR